MSEFQRGSTEPSNVFFDAERDRIGETIHQALGEMVLLGSAIADTAVPNDLIGDMSDEVIFRHYTMDERWRGTGSRRPIIFEPASMIESVFLSAKRRPAIVEYAKFVESKVRQFGEAQSLEPLANWQVDRAVVNKLGPKRDAKNGQLVAQPGLIYRHTDPKEFKGVVASVRIDPAEVTTWQSDGSKMIPIQKELNIGSLSLYAAADLCEQLGIEQVEHAVSAAEEGFSIVLLSDPEHKPFGLRSVRERLSR